MSQGVGEIFCLPKTAWPPTYIDKSLLVKRSDDNPETIKNRLKTYYDSTFPLIDFYKNKNCLVELDSGIESDEVIKNIKKLISF